MLNSAARPKYWKRVDYGSIQDMIRLANALWLNA